MAFLDELKKQAEAQKQQEQLQTQSKLAAVSQNFLLVQTRFKEVQRYLHELVNQLNVLNLDLKRTYYIEGVGSIDDYRPRDYALSIDSIRIGQKDFINAIILRFRVATERTLQVERTLPNQIDTLKEYLWHNNVKYQCTEYRNDRGVVTRGVFNIASEIPVTIKFSADFENAKVFLHMKNFAGLTVSEFRYDADEVNGELLDELAKYLIDKPNRFRDMGRHQASMRELTRQARLQREVQYPEAPAQREAEEKTGLFGRLKSILS